MKKLSLPVALLWFHKSRMLFAMVLSVLVLMSEPASAVDFDVNGTNVSLGGYAKLMMIYDSDGTVKGGPFTGDIVAAYNAPLDGTSLADEKDFRMTARESRIFLKTKSKNEYGVLGTHIEGDFYGGSDYATSTWSNSDAFRIRHAYGLLTRGDHVLLAGQTWSTFMDLAAGVPDMDIAGDPGFTFVRQAQLRYQYNLSPGSNIALSVENPDRGLTATGDGPIFINSGFSTEGMPDFIVKYFYANQNLTASPRFLVRRFDLKDEATGESDTAMGWAAALSSSINLGSIKLYATFMYGDGIGRYGDLGNIGGAGLTSGNEVKTVVFMSANGGFTLALSDTIKWTVGSGWAENDDDAYGGSDPILTANATKTAIGYHTNIKFDVTPAFQWAIGMGSYEREVMDGRKGNMIRWQSYFQYSI
ncbi:MAG: hypothetical protein KJP07_11625 [Desulfatitalea sp.]|nr:hypothetical protein [Desulfatitalea sp.]